MSQDWAEEAYSRRCSDKAPHPSPYPAGQRVRFEDGYPLIDEAGASKFKQHIDTMPSGHTIDTIASDGAQALPSMGISQSVVFGNAVKHGRAKRNLSVNTTSFGSRYGIGKFAGVYA